MAFSCGFFNSLNGDKKYNTRQISQIFDGIIRDGVYASVGNKLTVKQGTGMQVIVDTGRAWFNHTWSLNDSELPVTVEAADLVLNRIDAVVLEVDESLEVRDNQIKMVKGTAASEPQKPTMMNTEYVHQYPLAYISVKKGATSITTSDIEINVGKNNCPYVTSVLEAASIEELYAQWESQFSEWEDGQKTQFETWFAEIKGQLSEDPAGNLQLQIDAMENRIENEGAQIYTHSRSGSVHEFIGNGPNGRAKMTADVQMGDTFTVNGTPVTAYVGADDATGSMAGSAWNGKWVTFVYDSESNILNFKGGGGKVTVSGLSAGVIKKGTTVTVKQGEKVITSVDGMFSNTLTYAQVLRLDLQAASPYPSPQRTSIAAPVSGKYSVKVTYKGSDSDGAGKFTVRIGLNGSWSVNQYNGYGLDGTWEKEFTCQKGDQLMTEIGGYAPMRCVQVFLYLSNQPAV